MNTAIKSDLLATSVQTTDVLTKAIEAAQARISLVYASGRNTLIDSLSSAEFAEWDASHELAIVADSAGLVDDEDFDAESFGIAA